MGYLGRLGRDDDEGLFALCEGWLKCTGDR